MISLIQLKSLLKIIILYLYWLSLIKWILAGKSKINLYYQFWPQNLFL